MLGGGVSTFGLLLCLALSIQCGVHPVLVHSFTSSECIKSSIVVVTEIVKIIMSLSMFYWFEPADRRIEIFKSFNVKNSLTYAAPPAVCYAVQNLLMQYGYDKVDGTTFNILNQTKTIFAALFLYLHLNIVQSKTQVLALSILLVAAGILSFGSESSDAGKESINHPDYQLGCLLVVLASAISGLSGSLSQVALTSISPPRHTSIFTVELAIYGMMFLFGRLALGGTETASFINNGFFNGWTYYTFIPVLSNAIGGILAGAVIKYAGAVLKGFSLILGLMLTGFMECFMVGKVLGWPHIVSAMLVCVAIFLHSTFPSPSLGPPSPHKKKMN